MSADSTCIISRWKINEPYTVNSLNSCWWPINLNTRHAVFWGENCTEAQYCTAETQGVQKYLKKD